MLLHTDSVGIPSRLSGDPVAQAGAQPSKRR